VLKVQNLTKNFGGVKAVNNCNFEIEKEKITALIRPNVSGKKTVFNLISGICIPNSGSIFFKSADLVGCSVEQISNLGISRVFQQSRLFKNLTVEEILFLAIDNDDTKFWKNLFGLNKITKEKENKIDVILKLLDISEIKKKMASELSFGQKRLVELARTILNPHELLMLDEPVAGVNPKLRTEISKILLDLKNKGETILLIEHDMTFTLKIADRIIVLDAGKVIAQGTPDEIKNNPLVLEAYLGA